MFYLHPDKKKVFQENYPVVNSCANIYNVDSQGQVKEQLTGEWNYTVVLKKKTESE